jgi:CPA2 family monovalent cation:H+ antiporter-2
LRSAPNQPRGDIEVSSRPEATGPAPDAPIVRFALSRICYTDSMQAVPDMSLYKVALIVLGAAGIVIPLFHRLQISSVLGFMLVGVAVGPFGFGALTVPFPWLAAVTIDTPTAIQPVADLGVTLLLFMIGLELSFERLWLMRRLVFGLGALQLTLSAVALTGAGVLLGLSGRSAIVAGIALAMSSTAVVLQVLSEEKRLHTAAGRGSFAILLFQDLAVVPALFAITALAPNAQAFSLAGLGVTIAQALLTIAGIVALGRLVLRPLFRSVARTRSVDLFVAACLFVVSASALATAAAGLSMAIGALIGGLLLAVTEYRRQVEITIEPFKGLLVGVFLISIGLGLDIRLLVAHPLAIFGSAAGLIIVKSLVVAPLGRSFGLPWADSVQSGLLLGAGGEFGFVILAVGGSETILSRREGGFVLIVAALTMALIPLLSKLGQVVAPRLVTKAPMDPTLLLPTGQDRTPRVIVAGFGRVGQIVAAMLEVHSVPYVAIDQDPDLVAAQRDRGRKIYYGDMTRTELLRGLHLENARALVITLNDPDVAQRLVAGGRAERQDLLIIARARDAVHAAQLYKSGASDAVPETVEASLQLSEAVLVDIGIAMGPVIASIHEKRSELQAEIKAMVPGTEVRSLGRRRLRDALQQRG